MAVRCDRCHASTATGTDLHAIQHGDPYLDDGPPPQLGLQLYFDDIAALKSALATDGHLQRLNALRRDGPTQQAMLVRRYPVPDPAFRTPLGELPCTYLVAYEGVAEDLPAWLAHYIADHPPIMARFPGIRQIEIYTCIDWCGGLPWPRVAHMQRNKVVFDSQSGADRCAQFAGAARDACGVPPVPAIHRADHAFSDGHYHGGPEGTVAMPVDPQIQALLDMGTGVPATNTLSVPEARAQYEGRVSTDGTARRCRCRDGAHASRGPAVTCACASTAPPDRARFRCWHSSMAAASCCAAWIRMTACAATCVPAPDASWSRSITAWRPSTSIPPASTIASSRRDGSPSTQPNWKAIADRLAVGGDSAGGNLAAAAALRIRDEGGPRLIGQLLIYPVTDYHTPGTPSYRENADGYGLTRDTMVWFWDHYLTDPSEAADPYVSPLRARDFSRLPPALVVTAEYDPLRDEGEYYAEKLRAAGTPAITSRWDGMNHGFFFWVGRVDKAGEAMAESCQWLRQIFQ